MNENKEIEKQKDTENVFEKLDSASKSKAAIELAKKYKEELEKHGANYMVDDAPIVEETSKRIK